LKMVGLRVRRLSADDDHTFAICQSINQFRMFKRFFAVPIHR
jgi:hypothetical protein